MLVIALFFLMVVMLVAVAILETTRSAANNALNVQTKDQTFNAAETGVETSIFQLDANNLTASGASGTGALRGYGYSWEVVQNNLSTASASTVNDVQGAQGTVPVGPHQAYIAGWASSITGGRTVYVEAIVVPGPPIAFTSGAIVSGKTAQISHEQISDASGKHQADVHGQQITSSGGGQTPDGNSYATCATLGCNAITGYDGSAHIAAPPPVFLSAAQIASIKSSALTKAQSGGANVYLNGDWSGGGTWGKAGTPCTVYINGNVKLSGNATLTNYCTTTVVTGDWTMSGSVQYAIAPASTTHALFVLGSGGATFNGTTNTAGFVYSANGPITINGGGNGSFTGVLYSPYDVTMNGGGNASFIYDQVQSQVKAPNPNVVPIAQWEY